MKKLFTLFTFVMAFAMMAGGNALFAQGSISGRVIDNETGEPLEGATVVVDGTSKGALTRFDGTFMVYVNSGSYDLIVRYVGYSEISTSVSVSDDKTTEVGDIAIENASIGVDGVEILASLAQDRKTPVAASTITGKQIEEELSNKEFPEILRSTPSVYVTRSGGGFGDSRINVRGFDQRNTAVLINGIPVNDMENGWVYWSNWAGLSDVTRTIQVQRGLGASKLAINSVGGTINIITKTTDMESGGVVNFGVGNDGYLKFGATASTGRLDNGLAITVSGSRTQGRGYVDATNIDAWAYFASIAKDFGEKHQLVFTAIGAPQQHGQRSFRENVTKYVAYSDTTQSYEDLVKSSTTSDFDERLDGDGFKYSPEGNVRYNSDWGLDQNGEIFNVRRNFYHKPQMALNHYWTINEDVSIKSSAYYSIGRGGGSGDRGSIGGRGTWGYRDDNGLIRIADIIAWNSGTDSISGFPADGNTQTANGYIATERNGLIRRASMNEHNWLGLLSTANVKLNEKMDLTAGVDVRHYKGIHYRRVDDLMGTDGFLDPRDVNQQEISIDADGDGTIQSYETGHLVTEEGKEQRHKLNYDNDGIVGWQGVFAQLEVTPVEDFNFFVAASGSNTSYKRVDRFIYETGTVTENDTTLGETSLGYSFLGFNTKAGANYNINDNHNVYLNGGYYSRAPIFDAVFPNFTNEANTNVINEKVAALELGYGVRYKYFDANVNLYWTNWIDRTLVRSFASNAGDDFTANVQGLNAVHQGIELEVGSRPVNGLSLRGMVSIGDWQWQNNVEAIIIDEDNVPVDTLSIFAEGLKVGDAAQTTASFSAEYKFGFGLAIRGQYNYATNLFASFDPTARTNEADQGVQAYELPGYGLLDFGLSYDIDFDKVGFTVRANMNNVLDELYVQEAFDNPSATGMQDLSGFFGFGRTWSAGLSVRFK